MEYFMLFGFVGILRESLKIFCKNGKLMASLSLLTLSLFSLFYLCYVFSIKPVITDFLLKQSLLPVTDPKSSEFFLLLLDLKDDIRAFVGIEWIYVLITTAVSLFFTTAAIIAAAMVHGGRNLNFKELLISTIISFKKVLFTWFYTTLLGLGFVFLVVAYLLPMVVLVQQPLAAKVLAVILVILASVLYIYLAVIWILAFVVSVWEKKRGVEALGKAAQIVKGMQLTGFLLNLVFTVLFMVPYGMNMMLGILYCQCKKIHGEKVELQWGSGYNKVPKLPLLDESLA
ncbi:uncharacterized protein LOC123194947 [Mangifera indica]|uniref:uncharacterized protein LOC123194947 n=1 Tax=Mangifera indica TaxID=29780 RepID=UPI001CFB9B0B|nr:uncharacterized protein LOC123194947 [Mangifera indica]